MRIAGRWLLVALLAISLARCVGAVAGAAPRAAHLLAVNLDLQGKKPQLSPQGLEQLRAMLLYVQPDVVALHSVQTSMTQGGESASLVRIASALGMYYVFQPTTDAVGSALLSRYRIQPNATSLNAPAGAAVGLQATLDTPGAPTVVRVVRPPSAAVDKGAIAAVIDDLKAAPAARSILLASFNPGSGAGAARAAWVKAGLVDPAAGRRVATATFPAAKPAQRADLILVSAALKSQVVSYQVLRPRRVEEVSDHLPVAVTLRP
jgi:endonuclease/exonuclease/phosphatase family metal-dependent hydrolase